LKTRKYDSIVYELALIYKCKVKIIPYVIYHKKYRNEIEISNKNTAYIQSLVLKKTLESISFDRRRGIEEDDGHNEVDALVNRIAVALTVKKSEDIQQQ
jgi:hypothetical protein